MRWGCSRARYVMQASNVWPEIVRVHVSFRTDASLQIGSGHLMRCLALADALAARGARVRFLCREVTESLAALVAARGHELERLNSATSDGHGPGISQEADARATVAALAGGGCEWLVVDHYGLDAEWERRTRAATRRLMAIDDLADRPHECDVLLDQNLQPEGASRYSGKVPRRCQLLLGPHYALLRAEFATRRVAVRPRGGAVRRILVSFGGVDAGNYTARALEALRSIAPRDFAVDAVIGAEHPARVQLETLCREERFVLHIQTPHVADLVAAADLAVGSGGSMTWERCCLGLPALVTATAANQLKVVHAAALAGVLYALPGGPLEVAALDFHIRGLIANPWLRESFSRAGMALVDGRGASRVARVLGAAGVTMRLAVAEDAARVFEWRNNPSVRIVSHSSQPLEWDEHRRWLSGVLQNPAQTLLIGESAGRAVGVVRFDAIDERAEISIYMVPGHDSAVHGADVLAAAERWLVQQRPEVRRITAEVLGANASSHGLFAGAGYERVSTTYGKTIVR